MKHGHPDGAQPGEIFAFADSILKKGKPLGRVVVVEREAVRFSSKAKMVKAELNYTTDRGKWPDRKWESVPAVMAGKRATAKVPAGATAWYFNLFDERGMVVSSEHFESK